MRPTTSTQGILRPRLTEKHIDLRRYPVAADLDRYVERYWAVHWDLSDREPYQVELVPHPCVNVSFMPGLGGALHGVGTRKSVHPLAGRGWVFGVKFRPGGFGAYSGAPACALTDRSVPLREVFGPAADALGEAVLGAAADEHRLELVETFLSRRLPEQDAAYEAVIHAVAMMLDDRQVTRVEQVADRLGISVRSLQRLFRRYVGVGPKWVIRRYRMQDAAERLAGDPAVDAAALAVELGWFDQAHFTRDFSELIGMSPREYAAACAAAADREPIIVR